MGMGEAEIPLRRIAIIQARDDGGFYSGSSGGLKRTVLEIFRR